MNLEEKDTMFHFWPHRYQSTSDSLMVIFSIAFITFDEFNSPLLECIDQLKQFSKNSFHILTKA